MSRVINYCKWSLMGMLLPVLSFASEEIATKGEGTGLIGFAIGIGMGIAAFGGALGQGRIGAAFQEGVSRNPGANKVMFVPFILGLAFVETLVLFSWAIMFMLLGKV